MKILGSKKGCLTSKGKSELAEKFRKANKRLILLDYEGTLVNSSSRHTDVPPGDQLLVVLSKLCFDTRNVVVLISERDRKTLETWFGWLNISLVAEQGATYRLQGKKEWAHDKGLNTAWKGEIKSRLKKLVSLFKGSFIEEKEFSLSWNYRQTNLRNGSVAVRDIIENMQSHDPGKPFVITNGKQALRFNCTGLSKGAAVSHLLKHVSPDLTLLIGDDASDEEMFGLFKNKVQVTIKVGWGKTEAMHRIENPDRVLSFLETLVK